MELADIYQNVNEFHCDQLRKERGKKKESKPERAVQSAEPVRGKWSCLVIYIVLGFSILLTIVILATAITFFAQMLSEMKTTVTDFKVELSQLKSNVAQIVSEMKTSEADFKVELSQLKSNVTGMSEETRSSLAELRTKISQRPQNLPRTQCLDQWRRFQKNCYYLSSNTNNWAGAQRSCASMDANLVVINKAEEQAFIGTLIGNDYWIGLSDSISEGDWRWVDGTDYTSSVKFWNQGEPNNENNNEDCAMVYVFGKWNDVPCGNQLHWICEKSAQ